MLQLINPFLEFFKLAIERLLANVVPPLLLLLHLADDLLAHNLHLLPYLLSEVGDHLGTRTLRLLDGLGDLLTARGALSVHSLQLLAHVLDLLRLLEDELSDVRNSLVLQLRGLLDLLGH